MFSFEMQVSADVMRLRLEFESRNGAMSQVMNTAFDFARLASASRVPNASVAARSLLQNMVLENADLYASIRNRVLRAPDSSPALNADRISEFIITLADEAIRLVASERGLMDPRTIASRAIVHLVRACMYTNHQD